MFEHPEIIKKGKKSFQLICKGISFDFPLLMFYYKTEQS